jgi:hypothetical protein
MRRIVQQLAVGLICLGVLAPPGAEAAIIQIPAASFTAAAGLITFSEFPVGTVNPTYLPANYGGGAGAPTVTFEGFFAGQSLGGAAPPCPAGAALSGCVIGAPSNPLSLSGPAPNTSIVNDGANPTSPVLSGSPTFNGPIAILFSNDQAGVGLDGGFFDAIGGTAITAYNRAGVELGTVTNTALGIQFLGLVTDDGTAQIAGLLFHLVGPEPAGFAIDNVRFGLAGQVTVPNPVPEPASVTLLGVGLLGWGARRYRKGRS